MATSIDQEKTRIGKGRAYIDVNGNDAGVVEGDVIFTPSQTVISRDKGSWPMSISQGRSIITMVGAEVSFALASMDRDLLAMMYGQKETSNVLTHPLTAGYERLPVLSLIAYTGQYEDDGAAVTDQASGETGDGTTTTFTFTMSFTGTRIKPASLSIHDEDDVATITFDAQGQASGDGTCTRFDPVTGDVTVVFTAAPANTKAIQFDLTPKVAYEDKITLYACEFRGTPPPWTYGDDQMVHEHVATAVWDDDKCTAANGLWKHESTAVA